MWAASLHMAAIEASDVLGLVAFTSQGVDHNRLRDYLAQLKDEGPPSFFPNQPEDGRD
ncbi:Glycosyltransferase [Psidium guajava]|nr:Glycosyltransferase [Psidium guajava]